MCCCWLAFGNVEGAACGLGMVVLTLFLLKENRLFINRRVIKLNKAAERNMVNSENR